jgi:hypothetical protein
MYNVTFGRVHVTTVVVKKQSILYICVWGGGVLVPRIVRLCMCVRACILAYPACNSCTPYCDIICGPFKFFDVIS